MSTQTQHLTIVALDTPGDDLVDQWYGIHEAARLVDQPDAPPACRYRMTVALSNSWPGTRCLRWIGYLDGVAAGTLELSLPILDNLENAEPAIVVRPEHRRRGVATALYQQAVEAARAASRKRMIAEAAETLPGGVVRSTAGAAFLARMGFAPALREIMRRVDLRRVDQPALDRMLTDAYAKAEGYSLVQWRNGCPDEYIDDIAYLDSRLITDAPMGDVKWEPEKIDADRVRAMQAAADLRQDRRYGTGLRHDATGHLVAFTVIALEKTVAYHGWQYITIVEPRHRGHRLGTIAKIENLRFAMAYEPELREIDTWNAESNEYMISINEAMGFRAVHADVFWQRDI